MNQVACSVLVHDSGHHNRFQEDRHELAKENAAKKRVLPRSDVRDTQTQHRENEILSLTLRAGEKYNMHMQR